MKLNIPPQKKVFENAFQTQILSKCTSLAGRFRLLFVLAAGQGGAAVGGAVDEGVGREEEGRGELLGRGRHDLNDGGVVGLAEAVVRLGGLEVGEQRAD